MEARWTTPVVLLAALAGVAAAASCGGDGVTDAPAGPPALDSLAPALVGSGDTVRIHGSGLAAAEVTVAGSAVRVLDRSGGSLLVRMPASLPPCGDPLPDVVVRAEAVGGADSLVTPTLGAPIEVTLEPGEHAVFVETAAGCRLRFADGGTWGVAVLRPAGEELERRRVEVGLSLLEPADGAVAWAVEPARRSTLRPPRSVGTSPPGRWDRHPRRDRPPRWHPPLGVRPATTASAPAADDCALSLDPGASLTLGSPYTDGTTAFTVTSTSPSFAVLVESDTLATYPEHARGRVTGLAARLEAGVRPFLDRIFESWPDIDGDGRLWVVIKAGRGAAAVGASGWRVDDCPGDLVVLSHHLIAAEDAPDDETLLSILVHEAVHWRDLGPDLDQRRIAAWTIEAVPTLAERLWRWERRGQSVWGNHSLECPPEAVSCSRALMWDHRYGPPGLSHEGGYSHGSYLLQYLLEQAALEAALDPMDAFAGVWEREAVSPDDARAGPVFAALSGRDRSEVALQAGYLLSFYADEVVAEADARILSHGWDLPSLHPDYPLRSFRLTPAAPGTSLRLARPDGRVGEVVAGQGSALAVESGSGDVVVALVRN